jgi:hypothetical protein
MKKLIILSLLLCLTGCLTPTVFRGAYAKRLGRYATYQVTDYNDGFKVDMTYYRFEPEGVSTKTTFEARNKLKELALWIAEARKRKLRPIEINDIESSHYHNSATRYGHWLGTVRVHYTKKSKSVSKKD